MANSKLLRKLGKIAVASPLNRVTRRSGGKRRVADTFVRYVNPIKFSTLGKQNRRHGKG